jgi:tape measure domain-containing protein|nr:MAG TPA_asm: tail tape measure protein [Caudoviricetes sp.]
MASFANLTANLNLNIQNFASNMRRASSLANQFSANLRGQINGGMVEPAKKSKFEFKDVARIVQGIMISKVFYGGLNAIRSATDAVWEFSQELEYAKIAYSNLFGDTALADEFINVLKDFAAKTPFSFQESEAAAKRLLAYGIQYKNVMYVMNGVLAASSMQGNSQTIESVSRALGQIYTKGKLMNEEMRQLAEAGIPAYEILQEKLGLTQKQLSEIGKLNIPASTAINALVDGMTERFGGVVDASSKTLKGIISNIKDNASMLFAGVFEPLTVWLKSALNALGEFLYKMREIFELKGVGGVFEALFPPELHETLRMFVANLGNLFQAVVRVVAALGGLLRPVLEALIRVFNAFAPILTTVLNILSVLISAITHNATAMKILTAALAAAATMWVVFKVKAIATSVVAGVITLISEALVGLSAMLTFVAAHPFWSLLIALTGLVVGLSGGFGKLSNAISGMFKKVTAINGMDPDKILLPSQKERANDLNKFNEALDTTKDNMDDLADSTGKATKAAKGLLSFDEVFKLNQPDEGTNKGANSDTGFDLNIPDMSGIDASTFIPEVPSFEGFADNFVTKMTKALKDKFAAAGLGAILGAILGGLIGGPLGAKIGAVAGAIAGLLWNAIADKLGLGPEEKKKAAITMGIGTALGAILGGILGGPAGAKIGAIIGTLAGGIWGLIAQALGVTDVQQYVSLAGAAFSGFFAAIAKYIMGSTVVETLNSAGEYVFSGFAHAAGSSLKDCLKTGVIGAIVSLGVGLLSNALSAWLKTEFDLTDQDIKNGSVGQSIGNIIGSITGLILGGPIGSIVGGALGQLAGTIVGDFWSYLSTTLKGSIIGGTAGLPIGALIGTICGSIGGPLGAALGAVVGAVLGGLVGLIVEHWEPIKEWFVSAGESIASFFSGLGQKFSEAGKSIAGFFSGVQQTLSGVVGSISSTLSSIWTSISTSVSQWFAPIGQFFTDVATGVATFASDLWTGITTVFSDLVTAIGTFMSDIWTAITTVWNDIVTAIGTVMSDIWTAITTVWNDISTAVSTVCTTIWTTISNIFGFIKDLIVKVVTDIWNAIVQWFTPIAEEIGRVCSEAWTAVSTWFQSILTTITEKVTAAWTAVSTWFQSIWTTISEKLSGAWQTVTKFFGDILTTITGKVKEAWTTVSTWFQNIWNVIKEKISGAYSSVKSYFGDIYTSIKTKVSDSYNSVKTFFGNMYSTMKEKIGSMYTTVKNGISNIYHAFTGWISDLWNNVFGKFFGWINDGITKLREFFGLNDKAKSTDTSYTSNNSSSPKAGHATGGVFNREHIARFAEGNKAEAVIPLENAGAMQPFVDAVANGITASLMPIVANIAGNQGQLQPLYVGTLIADERSLKELNRKMQVIQLQENKRRG